ncbi:unnamed protein product [Medioppia subpectinata]|uniref:Uncharacterized protein n=1 Tax=Medioppia subpectinata TaxID=1979941 RepID=A0A7R9LW62_9ACAR|nr:unnamed protein product [Medioppia subpectinata]CAG2122278.1 unnamed protein product [Medioppia subpectinata]
MHHFGDQSSTTATHIVRQARRLRPTPERHSVHR